MIVAGVDVGAKTIKAVIIKDSKILSRSLVPVGEDVGASAQQALDEALKSARLSRGSIEHITATGVGRNEVPFAKAAVTEIGADARGIVWLFPSVRTVVDVGAEESRAIKCDEAGKVKEFNTNEKCAAGCGTFIEAMARAMEVTLHDFANLALKSTKSIPINAQCAVFAESEVVSLVHAKTPKEDICRALHDAIAARITSMVRGVGIEKDVALVGGVAKSKAFAEAMKRALETDTIFIPEEPEFVGALGAALLAGG